MKYIQTENLTIILYPNNEGGKLQIFNKHRSPYGYTPRSLIVSLYGVETKQLTYKYVQSEVDKVYSTFNYDEIDELLTKISNTK